MLPKEESDDDNTCRSLEKTLFDEVLSEWKRNVAPPVWNSKKGKFVPNSLHPDYKPLCTYVRKYVHGRLRTNYDLHYVNPRLSDGGCADVAFYVLKYMMKPSDRAVKLQRALHLNLPEDEFLDLWSFVRPRHFESEALGLGQAVYLRDLRKYSVHPKVFEHLRKGIELSKRMPGEPIPSFYSRIDGSSHPLAKYYKNHGDIFTMDDFIHFFYSSKHDADNIIIHDEKDLPRLLKIEKDFDEKVSNVGFQQTADELDDVFEPIDTTNFFDEL